jgi:hypothetical protein
MFIRIIFRIIKSLVLFMVFPYVHPTCSVLKGLKRLPAGRGCTQFLPQYKAQGSSGSKPPACPLAAAPPLVAAPSWVLKQQKCNGLLSHSSSLSSRNVVLYILLPICIANLVKPITLWWTEQVAWRKPDKTCRSFMEKRLGNTWLGRW